MSYRFIVVSSVALVASSIGLTAAAQTSLPAAVQADRVTVTQDLTNLQKVRAQLIADEQAGNSAAVAADRTALRLARMQVALDFGRLRQDAQGILEPDRTTLMAALTQLHADQVSNNSAVLADQAAVDSAEAQLATDRTAVFGDLGIGFGMHRQHWHG